MFYVKARGWEKLIHAKFAFLRDQQLEKVGSLQLYAMAKDFVISFIFLASCMFWFYIVEFSEGKNELNQESKIMLYLVIAKVFFELNRNLRSDPSVDKLDECPKSV